MDGFGPHINDLPIEMLEYIMDFLPLRDRKTASQVCRWWNLQAFSHRYMGRLKLRLTAWELNKQAMEMLQISKRAYRNLAVFSTHGSHKEFELITVILSKFGLDLEHFSLWTQCTLAQLKDLFAKVPNVKQLMVNVTGWEDEVFGSEAFAVLERLTDLKIYFYNLAEVPKIDIARMAPHVRKLSVTLHKRGNMQRSLDRCHALVPIAKLNLNQLETLELCGNICNLDEHQLHQFFEGVPLLKVAFLDFDVTLSVLSVISKKCRQLTTLKFRTNTLEEKSLGLLEGLTSLKVLIIDFCRYNIFSECKPLTSVQTLCLRLNDTPNHQELFIRQMHYLLPNLQTLKVGFFRSGMVVENDFVSQICRAFSRLKCLTVDAGFSHDVKLKGFDRVGDLAHLEELTLNRVQINVDVLPQCRLKRLKLKYLCQLTGECLLKIRKIFPQLLQLEVMRCSKIVGEDIVAARLAMAGCEIRFVEW